MLVPLVAVALSALVWLDSIWTGAVSTVCVKILARMRLDLESATSRPAATRFLVLVPMWRETAIFEATYDRMRRAFGGRQDCSVVFVTSLAEVPPQRRADFVRSLDTIGMGLPSGETTPVCMARLFDEQRSQGVLPRNFHHQVNRSETEHGKYALLSSGLCSYQDTLRPDDYVGVFDADSRPDPVALDFIKRTDSPAEAFQTVPLYLPDPLRGTLLESIAQAKFLLNFHYFLCREAPFYLASGSAMHREGRLLFCMHLLGHGQFIRLESLIESGGFRPPSCDSTLGFSLGALSKSIRPLPVLDMGTTPRRISTSFWQGVVWYNGVSLINREIGRLGLTGRPRAWPGLITRALDNVRWGLAPPLLLSAMAVLIVLDPRSLLCLPLVLIGYVLRDLWGWRLFQTVRTWTSDPEVPDVELRDWIRYALLNALITRLAWSMSPLYVLVCRLMGRVVELRKTDR